jgi:hypothetical protein
LCWYYCYNQLSCGGGPVNWRVGRNVWTPGNIKKEPAGGRRLFLLSRFRGVGSEHAEQVEEDDDRYRDADQLPCTFRVLREQTVAAITDRRCGGPRAVTRSPGAPAEERQASRCRRSARTARRRRRCPWSASQRSSRRGRRREGDDRLAGVTTRRQRARRGWRSRSRRGRRRTTVTRIRARAEAGADEPLPTSAPRRTKATSPVRQVPVTMLV